MKKIILFLLLSFYMQESTAQITVSDPAFLKFLQQNYPGCVTGNLINASCPAILATTNLNLSGLGISDLSGVEAFTGLSKLDVSYNNISNLPLSVLQIPNLNNFTGNNNQINSIPTSPSTIFIDTLILANNLIPQMNIGGCSGQFSSISPSYLDLSNNLITYISCFPTSLTYLDLSNNQIDYIGVGVVSTNNLLYLDMSYNELYGEAFSIGNTSIVMDFSNNQISEFIAVGVTSINSLDLSYNQLTTFPSLTYANFLNLSNNQISDTTSFDFGYLSTVVAYELDVSYNQLNSFSFESYDYYLSQESLYSLNCSNNNMTCISYLPQTLQNFDFSNNAFTCMPNIPPLLQNQLQSFAVCDMDPQTNPNYCNLSLALTADAFHDQSGDCLKDSNEESIFATISLKNVQGDIINTVGSSAGNWMIPYFGAGDFTAVLDTINKPFQPFCQPYMGALQDFTIYPGQTSVILSFPVECSPGFDVGAMGLFPVGWVFPGQTHTLTVLAGDLSEMYGLNCAQGVAGTVSFTINGPVSYVGPAPNALTPISVNGMTLSYDISDFGNVNSWSDFAVLLQTDTTAQVGESVCVSIEVTPIAGDNNPSNNQWTQCYEVINSYDPNDKHVFPKIVPPGYSDYLSYTINFQNTGNAPAFNIRLEDTLSTLLDLSTFEVVYFSHDMNYKIVNDKLTVYFPNIMLVDSTTNESESKGRFIYRVKPKSNQPNGAEIDNTCHIFFDYNAPIVTNTAVTLFSSAASIPDFVNDWSFYPNPNKGSFFITGIHFESIEIFDQMGRKIEFDQEQQVNSTKINLEHAESGVYFVNLMKDGDVIVKRIIVE